MAEWQHQLEQLVATRRSALVGYACVLTGDLASAEDLVHDAILKTFSKDRHLTGVDHAEAYVRRAIATTFLNSRRSHRRFLARMHLYATDDQSPEPATSIVQVDSVRTAMLRLTPRERACVVLRHMEQMSVREVAETLGIAEGSAKRYLSDAARKLAHDLGPLTMSGEGENTLQVTAPTDRSRR